ncbi:MAG: hypothetical protein U5K29_15650 [Acidimicrobiales bacterium]|nr:hypothetical protein [Acidimicrobiales bacterium]
MDELWQWAIGAVAVGIMAGLAGAGLLMMALTKGREDDPVYRDSARSMAISCFVFFTAAGVIIAVSIVNRDSFEDVPSDLVAALPDLLVAGLILVVGRAVALAAGSFAAKAVVAASARVRSQAALLVRTVITAAAVVLALAQVGVDTTLLQITGGALLFGLAAAAALLVGLGGRELAGEIAAGRYLSRIVAVGDVVEITWDGEVISGRVVGMHPATLELRDSDGVTHHLGNSQVLSAGLRTRADGSGGEPGGEI